MIKSNMTGHKYGRKAETQTIWIVIGIVLALAVVMILLLLLNNTTGKVKTSTGDTTDTAASTLKREMCGSACSTCKRVYPTECSVKWVEMSANNGCSEVMPSCA